MLSYADNALRGLLRRAGREIFIRLFAIAPGRPAIVAGGTSDKGERPGELYHRAVLVSMECHQSFSTLPERLPYAGIRTVR